MKYDKTQTGWVFINSMVFIIALISLTYVNQWGDNPLTLSVFLFCIMIIIFGLLMFYKLRVRIDEKGIHIIYGIGLIHIKIQPERVDKVSVVRNPWYYGLGIRLTPKGMLYNIHGRDGVEIHYFRKSSKQVTIGSSDCQNLKRAIESRYPISSSGEHNKNIQSGWPSP